MKTIKLLTNDEQINILDYLHENHTECIGNGAARFVFEMPKAIADKYDLPLDTVIKVAIGVGGINQTKAETEAFLNNGLHYPLAKIFAYGEVIEVMERVEPVHGFRDYLCNQNEEDEWYSDDFANRMEREVFDDILQRVYSLEDLFGETGDNGQIGMNANGEYVVYDYGYFHDSNDVQVSDIAECYEDNDYSIGYYLQELAGLLRGHYEDMHHLEESLLEEEYGPREYVFGINVDLVDVEKFEELKVLEHHFDRIADLDGISVWDVEVNLEEDTDGVKYAFIQGSCDSNNLDLDTTGWDDVIESYDWDYFDVR